MLLFGWMSCVSARKPSQDPIAYQVQVASGKRVSAKQSEAIAHHSWLNTPAELLTKRRREGKGGPTGALKAGAHTE